MKNRILTPANLMAKADTACSSARALLKIGDADGAVNRSYYAVFDAARAALLTSDINYDLKIIRTHGGLIGVFNKQFVKDGPISKDFGRFFTQAYTTRLTADYDGESVNHEEAEKLLDKVEAFVATIKAEIMPNYKKP